MKDDVYKDNLKKTIELLKAVTDPNVPLSLQQHRHAVELLTEYEKRLKDMDKVDP